MNIRIKRENLLEALSLNIKTVPVRTSIPILNNALLLVDGKKLVIKSTNLEQSAITIVGIEVIEKGECTINLKNFYEIIANLKSSIINILLQDNTLYIKDKKNEISLNTIPTDEYPDIPDRDKDTDYFIKINPNALSFAIDKVSFATSKDKARPILTGVLMEFDEKNINFIGINGFRLASISIESEDIKSSIDNLVISKEALDNISDIIKTKNFEDNVSMYIYMISGNQILFEIENIKFISRIIQGKYPDYKKIFPEFYSTSFEIKREDLKNILKLSTPFKFKEISIDSELFNSIENKVEFNSGLKEVGDLNSSIKTKIEGKDISVNFNANYIMDFLNHSDGEKISIELNSSESRKVSKIIDKNLGNYTYLIMPLYER
ncbi:DNA polymerase III subunit beta [Patescibacteria group bacterium]|nr:DNA polymerase III subunit beta [Patescibacteria group bacterium]